MSVSNLGPEAIDFFPGTPIFFQSSDVQLSGDGGLPIFRQVDERDWIHAKEYRGPDSGVSRIREGSLPGPGPIDRLRSLTTNPDYSAWSNHEAPGGV